MKKNKGFTLIELLVVVAIIGILSVVVLFSVTQYINNGKTASVRGNLSTLSAAGEVYYNGNNGSYKDIIPGKDFCTSSVVVNAFSQIPALPNSNCLSGSKGVPCCSVNALGNAWAACAQEFLDNTKAFCVDSRGVQRPIPNSSCDNTIDVCP